MAGTVTSGLSFFSGATGGVSDCDSVTDWTGSPTLDTEIYIQGTGALSAKVSKTTYTSMFTLLSPIDLSDTQLFIWAMVATIGLLDTKANGGLRIRVEDGAGNWGEWYVAGKDTWGGSWECFMVHTTVSFDSQSATPPDMTAITAVGIVCVITGSVAKTNFWWDALRYGVGLYIKGGTETDPATFDDFITAERNINNMWGIITEVEGIILVQSKLFIGSTTEGESTYFKDTNKVIVFRDRAVPVDFYEITIQGNATATTKVFFGEKVGGRGISGCIFRSAGAPKFKFIATDPNITDLGVYGCSFFDAGGISLPPYSMTREVLSTNFEACGEILPDTCIVKYCNIINADDRGIRISSVDHNISDCNIIGCPHGVHVNFSDTFVFDALIFSGNTYDIEHSVAGTLTVNCVNGSNPTTVDETGGGNTQIVNTVYVTIYVVDADLNPIQGAQVYVFNLDDSIEIMNQATDSNGMAQTTVNYTGDKSLLIRVRKSTPSATRYVPVETYGTLTSNGFTTTITLYEDTVL